HSHSTSGWSHRLNHVLHPGKIAALCWGHTSKVATVRIPVPSLFAPLFKRKGWIRDDAVERREVMPIEERGLAERVAACDLEVCGPVQKQVHSCKGGCGEILLLTKKSHPQCSVIALVLADVMNGF